MRKISLIIIVILIVVKVLVVASRVNADDYMPLKNWQNCQSNNIIYYGYCEWEKY